VQQTHKDVFVAFQCLNRMNRIENHKIKRLKLYSLLSSFSTQYVWNVTHVTLLWKVRLTSWAPLVVVFPPRGKFIIVPKYYCEIRLQQVPRGNFFECVCRCVTLLPVTFEYFRHPHQVLLCITGICWGILKVVLIWEGALAIIKTFPSIEVVELHSCLRAAPLSQLFSSFCIQQHIPNTPLPSY
jgi:hypothetical protein